MLRENLAELVPRADVVHGQVGIAHIRSLLPTHTVTRPGACGPANGQGGGRRDILGQSGAPASPAQDPETEV
jgi:hypothetical protein